MNDFKSVEHTLHFLRDKSAEFAKAKADRVYLEQFRKSKKAMLIVEAEKEGIKTAQARESYAYANEEYIQLLNGLRIAVEAEERIKLQVESARLRIEIWRTQQANNRAEYHAGNLQT